VVFPDRRIGAGSEKSREDKGRSKRVRNEKTSQRFA
jgi:hypothetical protein